MQLCMCTHKHTSVKLKVHLWSFCQMHIKRTTKKYLRTIETHKQHKILIFTD